MKLPTPEEVATKAIKSVATKISKGVVNIESLSDCGLIGIIKRCNERYREGHPIVSDDFYDHTLLAELERRNPAHEFLSQVEPEVTIEKTVRLPQRMLSTDKAYDMSTIVKWIDRVIKQGVTLGMEPDEVEFKVTPKLDGFAAYDDGKTLYTRGDGYKGTDITRVFDRGVKAFGSRGSGAGEIVVNKIYFQKNLSKFFENSRNVISGVIKEGELDDKIATAIDEGAVDFIPFIELDRWIGDSEHLIKDFANIRCEILKTPDNATCAYDTDGIVIECLNESIKNHMGHTSHHHRWQIAFKQNAEGVETKVNSVIWQTGKTGVITPVVEIKPTRIGGVTISRVTGHNYGNIKSKGIGAGAIIKIVRSGEVIPYITDVVTPANIYYPERCPSCGEETQIDGDHLRCTNTVDCSAQIEGIIEYWFKTLGNCDGFGPSVISDLVAYGAYSVRIIYDLSHQNFVNAGLGAGISANLIKELDRSRSEEIEDWRFLAAFSIHTVGKGGCERLLKHHRLEDIFDLTVSDFVAIDGFAEKTATVLFESLARIREDFNYIYGLGFNLSRTPLLSESETVTSAISNKIIVVTGSLKTGSRNDIHARIKSLGGVVGKAISGKTDILVIGEKVGASKMKAADKHNTAIMTEDAFIEMLA